MMIAALGVEDITPPTKSKAELAPEVVKLLREKYAAGGVKLGIATSMSGVWFFVRGTTKGLWSSYYNLGQQLLEWEEQWLRCVKGETRTDGYGCFSPYREGNQINWADWIKFAEELSANIDRTAQHAWNQTPLMKAIDIIKNAPDRLTEGFSPENWPWWVWAGIGVAGFAAFGSMLANAATIASSFRSRSVNGLERRRRRKSRR